MTASNSQPSDGIKLERPKITTIIFDVDDTLYDVGTVSGFFVVIGSGRHCIKRSRHDNDSFSIRGKMICSNGPSCISIDHKGFTAHRNTEGATSFMVEKLNFPSKEEAQIVRDEYFKKYHSTAKVRSSGRIIHLCAVQMHSNNMLMSYAQFYVHCCP